jgi:hypothetical protein
MSGPVAIFSVHMLVSKSRVNVAAATLTLPASSTKLIASVGTYTAPVINPKKKERKKKKGE